MTEDKMVGWHHRLNGHEFEQALAVGDGQRSLAYCSPWGHKICKGDWSGTADQIAKRIAEGFKNSSKHWEYVGASEYGYLAVGITYNSANKTWYGCICMSMENYGG